MEDNQSDRSFGEVEYQETDTENINNEEATPETEVNEVEETTESNPETDKETEGDDEVQYTEKGTKLDPDPRSAVHQQLANERRTRQQMEAVLSDPNLLSRYMAEKFGNSSTEKKSEEEVKEFTAEDFTDVADVAKVVNGLQKQVHETKKSYEERISQLTNALQRVTTSEHVREVANNITQGVGELKGVSELNPKSPDFIPGLEEKIVERYNQLDYDEASGAYRGRFSIADIGRDFVEVAKLAKSKGSIDAQTIVKKKVEGRVSTSTQVRSEVDSDKLSPGDSIAQGISKLFNN
jgi:hypothetical protein